MLYADGKLLVAPPGLSRLVALWKAELVGLMLVTFMPEPKLPYAGLKLVPAWKVWFIIAICCFTPTWVTGPSFRWLFYVGEWLCAPLP